MLFYFYYIQASVFPKLQGWTMLDIPVYIRECKIDALFANAEFMSMNNYKQLCSFVNPPTILAMHLNSIRNYVCEL